MCPNLEIYFQFLNIGLFRGHKQTKINLGQNLFISSCLLSTTSDGFFPDQHTCFVFFFPSSFLNVSGFTQSGNVYFLSCKQIRKERYPKSMVNFWALVQRYNIIVESGSYTLHYICSSWPSLGTPAHLLIHAVIWSDNHMAAIYILKSCRYRQLQVKSHQPSERGGKCDLRVFDLGMIVETGWFKSQSPGILTNTWLQSLLRMVQ